MGSTSAGPGARPPKPDIMNQMVLMLVFIVAIFIMFDQSLRQSLGAAVGVVLEPIVGFHGHNAVLTLFLTGLLMGFFSIVVRHFFVDWIEQARIARITSAFQKEFREARLTNNTYKIKKLTELQPQIMSQSLKTSQTQMKLMPVTMLVIIPVFAWLANFVYLDLPSTMLSVPWSLDVNMRDSSVLPNWVLLYSLLTLPFTQVLQKSLKFFSFRKRLEKLETEGE
jgi:uncharacterized membrane protein (DUF106 family)